MAKSRSIPTDLLSDPDYMELDSDTQVILLLFVLTADDEGRGRAHTGMLARHFNKPAERIEHALATLAELDLITCYAVGRHRYYQLLRWWEWQTLSKPTPSRYPSPPASTPLESCALTSLRETQETPGESWSEGEGKGRGTEQNPEEKKEDDDLPAGVTRFPHLRPPSANAADPSCTHASPTSAGLRSEQSAPLASVAPVQQVAEILRVPVTEALTHLVTEYRTFGSLALLGEADAAREWIEDTTRNRHNTCMTVAFFRRWLKREQEMVAQRHTARESQTVQMRVTQMRGSPGSPGSKRENGQAREGHRLPSLMHLAEEDRQARGARH